MECFFETVSEFSNEVLFDVLNEAPDLFIVSFSNLEQENQEYIRLELENPVNDKYLPSDLIKKIDTKSVASEMVIDALKVAQSKY